MMRLFVCSVDIHVLDIKIKWKMGRRPQTGITVEIENGLYIIWNIAQKNMVATKHVIFDVHVFPTKR